MTCASYHNLLPTTGTCFYHLNHNQIQLCKLPHTFNSICLITQGYTDTLTGRCLGERWRMVVRKSQKLSNIKSKTEGKSKNHIKTSQELRMLSRSLSDCKSLLLNLNLNRCLCLCLCSDCSDCSVTVVSL